MRSLLRRRVSLAGRMRALGRLGPLLGTAGRDPHQLMSQVAVQDSQLLTILDGLPIAVMLRSPDGTLLHVNPGAEAFVARLGVDLSAIDTSPSGLLAHIEVVDELGRPFVPEELPVVSAVRDGRSHDATVGFALPRGGHAWYNVRAAPVPLSDGTTGTVVTLDDMTEQHEARHRVALAERSLRLTFEHAPIGMAVIAPGGRLLQVNAALCELLGYEDELELLAVGLDGVTHPDEADSHAQWIASGFAETSERERVDRRFQHAGGRWIFTQVSAALIRDDDGTPLHLIAQVIDLSERRALEEELRAAAVQDPLTGLVNRRALAERLAAAEHRRRSEGSRVGLLFLDLDDFKAVNDTHGHDAGDRLLVEVGRQLLAATRRSDTVCRIGGDEFAILCTPVDGPGGLEDLIGRLEALRPTVRVGQVDVSVSHSIGSVVVALGEDLDGALRRADVQMYRKKRVRAGSEVSGAGR